MPAGSCARCSVARPWLHRHHVKMRCEGGTDADGIDLLCGNCHEDVHEGPMGGKSAMAARQTPEARAKRGTAMREKWQEPEYRALVLASRAESWTPEMLAKRGAAVSAGYAARSDEARKLHGARISAGKKGKGTKAPAAEIVRLFESGMSREQVAVETGRALSTVHSFLAQNGHRRPPASPSAPRSQKATASAAASMRKRWQDPEYQERVMAARAKTMQTAEYKARQGQKMRAMWQDPAYRERVLAGRATARATK